MPLPVRNRRRWRRSPPELVFGFHWKADMLEHDRLAEEQRITDLRRQQGMEQQRTDTLSHE